MIQEATDEDEEGASGLVTKRKLQKIIDPFANDVDIRKKQAEHAFWNAVDGPEILMVINVTGIHILDAACRDKIVAKIDYEDLLYVMGKGQTLKFGVVMH